ncbi:spore germination protein GerKB [Geomicrobium sp. JCM 19038]|nr:spore germination protein GerKB [Geomicrobium sp. JCM 19038]
MNTPVSLNTNALFISLFIFSNSTLLSLPYNIAPDVGHEIWWIPLVGCFIGYLLIVVVSYLFKTLPDYDLITSLKSSFGSKAGMILALLFLCQPVSLLVSHLNFFGLFINNTLLDGTPHIVVLILLMIIIVYATISGFTTIVTTSTLVGPFVLLLIVLTLLAFVRDIEFDKFLPMFQYPYEHYVKSVGFYLIKSVIDNILILFYLYPRHASNFKGTIKGIKIGYLLSVIILALLNFFTINALGPKLTSMEVFPAFRTMQNSGMLSDAFALKSSLFVIWYFTMFFSLCVYKHVISDVLRSINVKPSKTLQIITGAIIVVVAAYYTSNTIEEIEFYRSWSIYISIVSFALFFILLLHMKLKNKSIEYGVTNHR